MPRRLAPRHGVVNVHPGDLPHYAGLFRRCGWCWTAPASCAARYTGSTGIDTGPVPARHRQPLDRQRGLLGQISELYCTAIPTPLTLISELAAGTRPAGEEQDIRQRHYRSLPDAAEAGGLWQPACASGAPTNTAPPCSTFYPAPPHPSCSTVCRTRTGATGYNHCWHPECNKAATGCPNPTIRRQTDQGRVAFKNQIERRHPFLARAGVLGTEPTAGFSVRHWPATCQPDFQHGRADRRPASSPGTPL